MVRFLALPALAIAITVCALGSIHAAELRFPALTGRVVDGAGLMSENRRRELAAQLAAHEQRTTNQVVVVTLKSLQGVSIEEFGYQLGRHWGIGQKGKNNGALLIVAPSERKVRIEVGYGLEGTLTDAASKAIIEGAIVPVFKQGDMERGIREGVAAILSVLEGGAPPAYTPETDAFGGNEDEGAILIMVLWVIALAYVVHNRRRRRQRRLLRRRSGMYIGSGIGGSGSFGGGGGFGGGGFSGGGGGFGGGGASGGW